MYNVTQQSSQSTRGRSRSRSASSRNVRSRSVVAVPRSIRYNGVNKITRVVNKEMVWPAGQTGYSVGASYYSAFGIYFSPTGLTAVGSLANFNSAALPGASELSNLYEEIKLDKIELTFIITQTDPTTGATASTTMLPYLYVSRDVNDVYPNSLAQTQQQENCKLINPISGKQEKYSLIPRYNQIVQYTSASNSYASRVGFVSSAVDIPHYGVRIAAATTAVAPHTLNISAKFFMSLRNVK